MSEMQIIVVETIADLAALEPGGRQEQAPRSKSRRALLDAQGRVERFVDFWDDDSETLEAFGNPPIAPDEVQHGWSFDREQNRFTNSEAISPDQQGASPLYP